MSTIASFYLVRNGDIDRLKELALQPVGPIARGKWYDPVSEFLAANARALATYEWSGSVIGSEVYLYLQSRAAVLDDYCDRELSAYLSQARNSDLFAFQARAGEKLARLIEYNWPDEAVLHTFLKSPDMTSSLEEEIPVEAVFAGLRILKDWLSQVDDSTIGLLIIG